MKIFFFPFDAKLKSEILLVLILEFELELYLSKDVLDIFSFDFRRFALLNFWKKKIPFFFSFSFSLVINFLFRFSFNSFFIFSNLLILFCTNKTQLGKSNNSK